MRVAVVYDCLYPNTVGGAERWLRCLVEDLSPTHDVTYVTRRQWSCGEEPAVPGVRVVAVSRRGPLYTPGGRRRILPPLGFSLGVFLHFVRHRRSYDVVHCLSYPYLPLIALRLALAGRSRPRVFCEWLECLTPEYWTAYAGRPLGLVGQAVQGLCVRLTPAAFVFSDLVARRLRASGYRGDLHRLTGLWEHSNGNGASSAGRGAERNVPPFILFAGRHVPDKRPTVVPEALMLARRARPGLRAVIVGDGPERPRVLEEVERLGLGDAVDTPGFVSRDELERLFRQASCLVAPSVRDGHGMVVVEAAAAGLPAVVCDHPDNAAIELIEDGVNGSVAGRSSQAIANAIVASIDGGEALRESTASWFAARAEYFSMGHSIRQVKAAYEAALGEADRSSRESAPLRGVGPLTRLREKSRGR